MKPSEFKISIRVGSYDTKIAENVGNCYDTEKHIVSKLSKLSIPNFNSTNGKFYKDCVKISRPYLLYFLRIKLSKSVKVELGWFIVLNGSAGPKMSIKLSLYFLLFF